MKSYTKLIALLLTTVTLLSATVSCNESTPSDTTGSAAVDTTVPTDTTEAVVDDTTTVPDTEGETTSSPTPPEELL